MTKDTLKQINSLHAGLLSHYDQLHEDAEQLEEKYSERSDTWQESDNGAAALEKLEYLNNALADVLSAIENLENIVNE